MTLLEIMSGITIFVTTSGLLFLIRRYLDAGIHTMGETPQELEKQPKWKRITIQILDWPIILFGGLILMFFYFNSTLSYEGLPYFIWRTLTVIISILIFLQITRWLFLLVDSLAQQDHDDSDTEATLVSHPVTMTVKIIISMVLIIFLLSILGISIVRFLFFPILYVISTIITILVIGLGISSRFLFENRVAGYILKYRTQLSEGTEIIIKDTQGRIEDIGSNYTKLVTSDNITIILPNKELINENVTLIAG